MPTLYIIDGYGQFFRAFHAIRTPMSSPVTKEPTNMTFGFVGMLLKLLRGEGKHMAAAGGKPDYVVVALDVSGDRGTFRSQLYPEYKAHRPEIPEALPPQVDRALALLKEIGVPVVGSEGFEADDVIATLVTRLREEHPDLRVRIIAKDKDLKQLLSGTVNGRDSETGEGKAAKQQSSKSAKETEHGGGSVEMYDVHTDTLITEETLKTEMGLAPAQVIDMLALMGDTVDNVPGVEGVGEKTAAALIAQYGSLENVVAKAAAGEIKGKRGENIKAAAELLPLSKQLVTLRHDAPVAFELEDARASKLKLEKLLPILRELGFNRYQEEVRAMLGGSAQSGAAAPSTAESAAAVKTTKVQVGGDSFSGGLFDAAPAPVVREVTGDYRAVTTREALAELVGKMKAAEVVSIDTETTSLSPRDAKLCGISVAVETGVGYYVPIRSPEPSKHLDEATVLAMMRGVLEDPGKPKCGHNLKYDLLVLRNAGVELRGLTAEKAQGAKLTAAKQEGEWLGCDTMVASYLIDSSRSSHSKDALCLALLGRTNIPISDLIGSGKNQRSFETVPLEQAVPYAAEDADVTLQLRNVMMPQLKAMGLMKLWEEVELPLVEVLAELEWNGILVDPKELDRQRERLEKRIGELRRLIDEAAMGSIGRTFNPDSPKQLAAALFNKPTDAEPGLGLKSTKKTKTGYSTDIEVLEKLAGDPEISTPIPELIVEHRQLTKLVGTYLESLKDAINPRTGRIHSSFNQTGAATGRLSSSDPNLQNIPIRTDIGREIRKAFIAPPGHLLITADYSQIELRLLAHLSRDPALIEAFHRGEDIHVAVAAQIHGVPPEKVTKEQRNGAKMVNFGIVYGITSYGLARRLKIGEKEAAEIIAGYKKKFAGITTFLEECIAQAKRYGYVETMLKRRRPIMGIDSKNPNERALAERVAINSVVQGSAADLIKMAMIDLHRRLGGGARQRNSETARQEARQRDSETARQGRNSAPSTQHCAPPEIAGVKMLLQIHDELVFEAREDVAEEARELIVSRMEGAMELSVPLKVDSGMARDWFGGK
ncbi:MAG: DNA polymerase I [Phycisphaeraceae bacterium]|nr:DNA polymerase I [Phycisphaeraceae bacterium]